MHFRATVIDRATGQRHEKIVDAVDKRVAGWVVIKEGYELVSIDDVGAPREPVLKKESYSPAPIVVTAPDMQRVNAIVLILLLAGVVFAIFSFNHVQLYRSAYLDAQKQIAHDLPGVSESQISHYAWVNRPDGSRERLPDRLQWAKDRMVVWLFATGLGVLAVIVAVSVKLWAAMTSRRAMKLNSPA